jgi:CAAX prenyl protease-like protein
MFLNPPFEELIVRTYLMAEVIELTSSRVLAILLSVAVQFCYQLYYDWYRAASVSCAFLLLSLYYVRTRQALPIIVAHGLIDVFGMIRLSQCWFAGVKACQRSSSSRISVFYFRFSTFEFCSSAPCHPGEAKDLNCPSYPDASQRPFPDPQSLFPDHSPPDFSPHFLDSN